MFINLELFLQEREVYNQKVVEIKSSSQSPQELDKSLLQAKENFRAQIRKYLSTAISTINTFFQCQYSIYKIGKDFDANFHVVETNVRKTRTEVIADMEQFKKQAMGMNLKDDEIMKINLAMDILLTYSDDASNVVDSNREHFLQGAKVVATSIIEPPAKTTNAFEEKKIPQSSFNPYANQPVQLDSGFSSPTYENKTLVDPFASIYGGGSTTPQNLEPIPAPPQPPAPPSTNVTSDASFAIFGQGAVMNSPVPPSTPVNNSALPNDYQKNPEPNQGFKFFENSGVENSPSTIEPMQPEVSVQNGMESSVSAVVPTFNPIQVPTAPSADADTFTAYLKPESMDSVIGGEEEEKKKELLLAKEKAFLGSKIIKGILIIPIVTFVFLGIVMLIFWGLNKFNLIEELTGILGSGMIYAEFALCLFFALMASSVALDSMAKKTKYVSKHAVASLTLFSVAFYGLTILSPNISDIVSKFADYETSLKIFVYYSSSITFGFFVGTFIWIFSFLRTKQELIKRKLNIVEIVGFLWLIYTLILPAISIGTSFIGIDVVSEKLSFLYDYSNSSVIIMIASFVLFLGLSFFSKKEEELL